jgi:hypothetical protein
MKGPQGEYHKVSTSWSNAKASKLAVQVHMNERVEQTVSYGEKGSGSKSL